MARLCATSLFELGTFLNLASYLHFMNSKRSLFLATILTIALSATASAQSTPNFTGTWKLNVAKSDTVEELPQSLIATVDHKDPVLTYTVKGTAGGREINETESVRTDGTPTKGANDITIVGHWDGPNLVLEGTAPDQSPIFEVRLSLSSDGKTITRIFVRKNGNQQQTRNEIYDKM